MSAVMTTGDVDLFPAVRTAGRARRTVIDMRVLHVGCYRCDRDAETISDGVDSVLPPRPTCSVHTEPQYRALPALSSLSLALIWLVCDNPGSPTVDLANRGAPSWTVRGTGVVLSRLARLGLVSAGTTARGRAWYLTEVGRSVSAAIQPGPPANA